MVGQMPGSPPPFMVRQIRSPYFFHRHDFALGFGLLCFGLCALLGFFLAWVDALVGQSL
jgi:hypothetical protein